MGIIGIGIGMMGSGRGLWDYRGYYGVMGWDGGIMGWHSGYELLIRVHFRGLRPISVTPNGEEEPRGWDYRGRDWDDGITGGIMGWRGVRPAGGEPRASP